MEIGNAIVLAICLFITWEACKLAIQFWWQRTIQERRHQEELKALKQPEEIKVRGTINQQERP